MNPDDTYIIFELDAAAYAVRSASVQHVDMLEHITPVPNTAAAVDGVVFSRGQVIPAINLRARFGLPRREPTPQTRLIFLHVQQRVVALIVDSAREFQRIAAETIRPIQKTLVGIQGNYVEGVATIKNRSVLILDVGAVLTIEEITPPTLPAESTPAAS
ncbi:MAG TPA: chemotaxis protein CheW [Lacunisphaera sp.]|jgi:purine-binding chemotaxis protein CheW